MKWREVLAHRVSNWWRIIERKGDLEVAKCKVPPDPYTGFICIAKTPLKKDLFDDDGK